MQAVVIDAYGGPEVLRHRTINRPSPQAGEVLVRVANAGINFMDIATREGRYAESQSYRVALPCVRPRVAGPGRKEDAAGRRVDEGDEPIAGQPLRQGHRAG